MKVVFYGAPGKYREDVLREAVARACSLAGDAFEVVPNSVDEPVPADVCFMVGMKSTDLRRKCVAAGVRVVTCDKGYDRKDDWWRVAIDTHQPTRYLSTLERPADRAKANGWRFPGWKPSPAGTVIIASGGLKYHHVHSLAHPTLWVAGVADAVRRWGFKGRILYRPKPSMPDVTPVADTVLSREKYIHHVLKGCHALVTFGSNACFEATLHGVPSIVLGDAVSRDISSVALSDILDPHKANEHRVNQWLADLAYCQFREAEFASGVAWPEIRRQLDQVAPCAH